MNLKKKKVFKKNTEKYNELCHLFCTSFVETLGEISEMTYQDIENLFRKRIKKICVYGTGSFYDYSAKKIKIDYDFADNINHVFFHEALHAISAQHIRRSFFKAIKSLLFKSSSDFLIDEGITEYYASCMEKKEKFLLTYLNSMYQKQAIIMGLTGKLISPKEMMKFYLKNDHAFIRNINKTWSRGYSKIKKIVNTNNYGISTMGFDECNEKELSPFYDMVQKKFLKPVSSMEVFEENVNLLLEIYSQDMYTMARCMYYYNNLLEKESDESKKEDLIFWIQLQSQNFEKLKNILKGQWRRLGINDDKLFNELIIAKIKEKYPYVYDAVTCSNAFPLQPSEEIKGTKSNFNSYGFDNVNNINSCEYIQEETMSNGRKR